MSEKTYRTYSKEFKVDAVKLVLEGKYKITEAVLRLGVPKAPSVNGKKTISQMKIA